VIVVASFLDSADPKSFALFAAGTVVTLAWVAALGVLRMVRQPRRASVGRLTMDLGLEPPAVANLLVNNFRPRRDAVPATLLDLAARGFLELEQSMPGRFTCRIRTGRRVEAVSPYEARVLALLEARAIDGVVPAAALTTGPGDRAARWWKGFRKEVVEEAQGRGLSRDIWDPGTLGTVSVVALVPAPLFGLAAGELWAALVYLAGGFSVIGAIRSGGRQRDTPTGLQAASRWLGIRSKLRENPQFGSLPPTAVTVWERYLAYAAALGLADAAVGAMPMGADSDTRAWSAYGGEWHEVRVRYGRLLPAWGQLPAIGVLMGLGGAVLGLAILYPIVRFGTWSIEGVPETVVNGIRALEVAGVVAGGLLLAGGLYVVIAAALDLFTRVDVTGQVLRLRRFGSSDKHTYHVAVDDGRSIRVRAWIVPRALYSGVTEGDVVRATVSPNLGYVHSLQALTAPTAAQP
jgi:hypothetical protein